MIDKTLSLPGHEKKLEAHSGGKGSYILVGEDQKWDVAEVLDAAAIPHKMERSGRSTWTFEIDQGTTLAEIQKALDEGNPTGERAKREEATHAEDLAKFKRDLDRQHARSTSGKCMKDCPEHGKPCTGYDGHGGSCYCVDCGQRAN